MLVQLGFTHLSYVELVSSWILLGIFRIDLFFFRLLLLDFFVFTCFDILIAS